MFPLFALFGCWLAGMALLFLNLKNKNHALTFQDVLASYILSTGVGVVFAFAGYKANVFHWVTCIAFAGLAAYITHKFLEKSGAAAQPQMMAAVGRQYRPGSMGAADQAANQRFVIGAGVVYLLVILAFTVFNTDMRDLFRSAPAIANIGGLILVIGSYGVIWLAHKQILPSQSGWTYWLAWAFGLTVGLWMMIGFQG